MGPFLLQPQSLANNTDDLGRQREGEVMTGGHEQRDEDSKARRCSPSTWVLPKHVGAPQARGFTENLCPCLSRERLLLFPPSSLSGPKPRAP